MMRPMFGIVVVGSAAAFPISSAAASMIRDSSLPERPRPA